MCAHFTWIFLWSKTWCAFRIRIRNIFRNSLEFSWDKSGKGLRMWSHEWHTVEVHAFKSNKSHLHYMHCLWKWIKLTSIRLFFFFLCWNQHKTQKTLGRSFQSSVSWSVPSTATLQHTSRWTSFSLFPSGVFTYKNYEKQLFVTFYFILSQMCSMNACFEELCKSSLLRHTLRNKRI